MNKKRTGSTNLNLKNPKQLKILRSISIAEGRITKNEILETGNKEIFYRMKNNGFIKEIEKGSQVYKATGKLNSLINKTEGISVGNGCSTKHSKALLKNIKELPISILDTGKYITGAGLKNEMEKNKKKEEYHISIEKLKSQMADAIREREVLHKDAESIRNATERFQENIDYKADMDCLKFKQEILNSDTPIFVPDFGATVYKKEAEEILHYLETKQGTLKENSREYRFMEENCKKLENIISTMELETTLYFEIVTDSYGRAELERHYNYEIVMNRDVLYLC